MRIVVPLARSRFWSIRDEANRRELKTRVTRNLPGASECWYQDASRSYWCAWRVTPSERKDEVARLASAIGQCDRVQHAYSDDSVDEDRKSTRLNSSHGYISYAVFCLKKKKITHS